MGPKHSGLISKALGAQKAMNKMKIEIKEIVSTNQINSMRIRAKAKDSSKSAITTHYLILNREDEVGFISIDRDNIKNRITVYEIFIEPTHRRKGYASEAMRCAERLALHMGCDSICVLPLIPGDRKATRELIKWCLRLGYEKSRKILHVYIKSPQRDIELN